MSQCRFIKVLLPKIINFENNKFENRFEPNLKVWSFQKLKYVVSVLVKTIPTNTYDPFSRKRKLSTNLNNKNEQFEMFITPTQGAK